MGIGGVQALNFRGAWNASTNTPALASGVGTKGEYFIVGTDGSTDLDGVTDWKVKDWATFNGTAWSKVDNTEPVAGAFTEGSIPFANSVGLLDQNNDSWFYDNATKRVGIGTNTPGLPVDIAATTASMQQTRWSDSAFNGAGLVIQRSRGAFVGLNTIVVDGDNIGSLNFRGYDSTAFTMAAQIQVLVDGVPGAGDMPGRLVFLTTADGASTPTERMRIDSAGNVGIGATPNAAALLDVSSTTRGLLLPRMTTTQRDAIGSPPDGLMIYNTTTNKANLRANNAWEAITSA